MKKIISLTYANTDKATLSYTAFDLTDKSQLRLDHCKLEVKAIEKLVLRLDEIRQKQREWREEIMEAGVTNFQGSNSGSSIHHFYPHPMAQIQSYVPWKCRELEKCP